MFGERRKHQRYCINRTAKFATELGALPQDCMIADISEHGARVFSETAVIPDNFVLLISGDAPMRQECRVVWRLGDEVGVTFVTKEREQKRLNAMKEFQSKAREIFRQHS